MAIEIERKYLVNKDKLKSALQDAGTQYRQGYLLTDPQKTIRVRIGGDKAFLTIKGISTGASRLEFEYEIPKADAQELLDKFCTAVISKTRYEITFAGKLWEVDVFSGDNEGLIVAEIELESESEKFELPDWADKEVTGEEKYYNSNLSINPYKNWKSGSTLPP